MLVRLTHFLLLLCMISFGLSQDLGYTVQIVAVSSELKALQLQENLGFQGYPAYLVTVPTSQGFIFRLRVGSFVNRAAAAVYADAMQGVLDSSPSPALAEGIPQNLIPLEPELLGSYPLNTTTVQVLPWQDTFAFRIQPTDASSQAQYILPEGSFSAWRAAPQEDGSILRVYSEPLWPEAWKITPADQLEQAEQAVLERIASLLSLTPEQVKAFEFHDANKVPFLVLAETMNLQTQETSLFRVLGQPRSGLQEEGPQLQVFSGETMPEISQLEPLFEPTLSATAQDVAGEGWEAKVDGVFSSVSTPAKTWRAVAGRPIWARGNFLVSLYKENLLIYRLN